MSVGFCHRDIKPENIVLNPYELYIDLIDFGLAARIQPLEDSLGLAGTKSYFDPHLLKEKPNKTNLILADYYSIGVTIIDIACPGFNPQSEQSFQSSLQDIAQNYSFIGELLNMLLFSKRNLIQTSEQLGRNPLKEKYMIAD